MDQQLISGSFQARCHVPNTAQHSTAVVQMAARNVVETFHTRGLKKKKMLKLEACK